MFCWQYSSLNCFGNYRQQQQSRTDCEAALIWFDNQFLLISQWELLHQTKHWQLVAGLYMVVFSKVMYRVFIELAPRPIQSISREFCLLFVCPLGVTFYWRGIETYSQRGSSTNYPNKNWENWFKQQKRVVLLYQSPNLPQPH